MAAGARAICWCVCTAPAGNAGGDWSTRSRLRDFVRFLGEWQHATPSTRTEGRAGLLSVLEQLQGIEAPAAEWEAHILPARVEGYDARWLDELCLSGEVVWGRLDATRRAPGSHGHALAGDAAGLRRS